MKRSLLIVLISTLAFSSLTGCSAKVKETEYTKNLMLEMNEEIGMPEITEFYEKRLAKDIYEKRDDSELICYVYSQDKDGYYVYKGRSRGYGLPSSTQYTCPENYVGQGGSISQADPNGLYSGEGQDATWLLMIDDATGGTYVMCSEPDIVTTEHKLPLYTLSESSIERIEKYNIDY